MATVKKRLRKIGTRPDGTPEYRVDGYQVRYVDPHGRERSKSFPLGAKAAADAYKTAVESQKLTGDWIDPRQRRVTVDELASELLGAKHGRTSEWGHTMYRRVSIAFGHRPIGSLDHLEIQAWVNQLTAEKVGPDSVRGSFRILHETVRLALRSRRISHDPCLGIVLPSINRREMLFLSPPQIDELAEEIERRFPGHGYGLLVRFAAYSGCRAGEIGALQARDISLATGKVFIGKSRRRDGTNGSVKGNRKGRWVGLPRQLMKELEHHLAERGLDGTDYVWVGERRSAQLDHKWFYKHRWAPVVDSLTANGRLPLGDRSGRACRLRFHDLRHTCVALLIAKSARQYHVMRHLGHTRISTTVDTYGHLFPETDDEIVTHLEEVWDEAVDARQRRAS